MTIPLPFPGLATKIKFQYNLAIKSNQVIFTETTTEEVEEDGIPFEIKLAPSLANKPTRDDTKSANEDEKKKDPFEPPYIPELYVAEDTVKESSSDPGESFVILLNKFCITPRHFLLVTKDFVPQRSPLTPAELYAAYSIVKQLGAREKHVAFFNCGPESGASQPHKHLQFVPLGVPPFDSYVSSHRPENANAPFQLPLPYANFTVLIQPPSSDLPSYLGNLFLSLLDLTIDHLRRLSQLPSSPYAPIRLSTLSYNLIITDSSMHIVPRVKEAIEFDGERVSINSLGFAGTVLVKSEKAGEEVRRRGVLNVLKEVGFPPVFPGDTTEAEEI